MAVDSKFSNFADGGTLSASDIVVGLSGGVNTKFTYDGGLGPSVIVPVSQGGTNATTESDARTNLGVAIGSDVQAWDAGLDALAALAGTGILVHTAANTYAERTITGTVNQVDITNGNGVSGNPTLSLSSTIQFPGTTGYSDTNGILDENSNEQLIFNTTASAVNHIELTNAATGDGPLIQAAGDDTNIDLKIQAKGTGNVLFDGSDVICGNPGTEASGIDIGGANYNSNLKSSELGATNLAQFIMHRHSTTVSPVLVGARSNSDTSAHSAVTASQSLFVTYGAGWTGAEYNLFGGIDISVDASGTISDSSSPGRIRLQVTADGATVPSTALTIANDKTVTLAGDLDMSMTDGQLLIGNTGSALSKATLTAGTGISVSNAGGSITISATGGGGGVDANFTFMLMGA